MAISKPAPLKDELIDEMVAGCRTLRAQREHHLTYQQNAQPSVDHPELAKRESSQPQKK